MTNETQDFEALYLEAKARIRQLERQVDLSADQLVGKDKQIAEQTEKVREYKTELNRVSDEFENHKRLAKAAVIEADTALTNERKSREEEILWIRSEEQQARADLIFERDSLRESVKNLQAMLTEEQKRAANIHDIEAITSVLKTDLANSRKTNAVLQKELGVLAERVAALQDRFEART